MKNKAAKQKGKRKGAKDTAFGCDLGEHLHSSSQDGKVNLLLYNNVFRSCFTAGGLVNDPTSVITEASANLVLGTFISTEYRK